MKEDNTLKNYLILFFVVILAFAGIILFTGFLGDRFGESVENAVLVVLALGLIRLYIKSKRS